MSYKISHRIVGLSDYELNRKKRAMTFIDLVTQNYSTSGDSGERCYGGGVDAYRSSSFLLPSPSLPLSLSLCPRINPSFSSFLSLFLWKFLRFELLTAPPRPFSSSPPRKFHTYNYAIITIRLGPAKDDTSRSCWLEVSGEETLFPLCILDANPCAI